MAAHDRGCHAAHVNMEHGTRAWHPWHAPPVGQGGGIGGVGACMYIYILPFAMRETY